MGSLSNFAETELLDHTINGNAYTPVATVYIALATADPTDAGTGASMNEVANSNGYARIACAFGAASSRTVSNSGTLTFSAATGSWGTVTHFAILDSATHGAGNMLAHGALTASRSVVSGNTPSYAAGEIDVLFNAGSVSDYLVHKWLDFMFRNQAFTSPATYIGLTTATVSDSDTGSTITEVSGGSYARELVDVNGGSSPTWTAVSGGAADNAAAIVFGPPTADWGTCVASVICDASSAGNLLFYDNAMTDSEVLNGDTFDFATGAWDVSVT